MKTQIGQQQIEDAKHIRIFHSKLLLSKKRLPIIGDSQIELTNWLYMNEQRKLHADLQHMGMQHQNNSVVETENHQEIHPLVEAVMSIDGVEYAIGASYQLIVLKGKLFDWEEISKSILLLMSSFSLDLETSNIVGD